VRRAVNLIATVEAHDLATLAAYTLAHVSLHKEDWGEIARRHGVDAAALMRAGGSTRPSADHIKGLRTLDPLGLVKATVEALLIRQAQAARDDEPDNHYSAGPDPVFKLYTGDQTSAPPTPPALCPRFHMAPGTPGRGTRRISHRPRPTPPPERPRPRRAAAPQPGPPARPIGKIGETHDGLH